MIYAKVLINIFAAIVEVLIIKDLYGVFGNKKAGYLKWLIPIVMIYVLFSIIATLFIKTAIIMLAVNCIILFAMSYAFRIKKIKIFYALLIFVVMGMIFEMLVGLLICAINGINISSFQNTPTLYLLGVLIVKPSSYFVVRLIKSVDIKVSSVVEIRVNKLFLMIPLATIFVLFILSYLSYHSLDVTIKTLVIFSSILLITANIATFLIYDYTLKQIALKNDSALHSAMLEQDTKNYTELLSLYISSSKESHDFKHKLYEVNAFIEENNPKGKLLLKEMCDVLDKNKIQSYTGISSVDALLNVKKRKIEEERIKFDIAVFLPTVSEISGIELCVMLGNLIENADKAAKLTDDKFIKLSISQQKSYLSIKMENSSLPITFNEGKPLRKIEIGHGYGLANINEVVEKYDGEMSISYENNVVTTVIMIRNIPKTT